MRKAKVVAIVCGMIASCLFGGFAVVEAATITLDDSSAIDVVETVEATTEDATESATTVTSIKTTAPAATSTTTISSDKTPETTAATKETTSAASVMTTAVQNEAAVSTTTKSEPKTTAIAVRVNTKPAAAKATTSVQTTTVKTTTTTTTVVTTKATTVATTQAPVLVTEAVLTNPPMPAQNVTETVTEPIIEPVVPVEPEIPPVTEEPVVVVTPVDNGISESDYILLCNAVAHEAGANSISATEKAKVVEVIMNRVNSSSYPNTIYDVLTQKYQFSGSSSYVDLGTYSSKVTDMVKESVDLYFADPSVFNEGYLSFTGDGVRNYFR